MIYIIYLVLAAGVVYLSVLASKYVDMLEKMTPLSGAFIGGIMLSAVTSLPEMFTSISSTLLLDKPGLCMGNILGSDLFNIMVLAVLIIAFSKDFSAHPLARSHERVVALVTVMYIALSQNYRGVLDQSFFGISVTSVIIIALYAISVRLLATEDGENLPDNHDLMEVREDMADNLEGGKELIMEDDLPDITLKGLIIRFIVVSIGIIGVSIAITYVTDEIAVKLGLGSGIAGAIFLGIATSLPEVSSTMALFKMRSFDIGFGNIIGSNLFNFTILAVVDLIYIGRGVYDFSDPKNIYLMNFGLVATLAAWVLVRVKKRSAKVALSLLIIGCYAGFLIL